MFAKNDGHLQQPLFSTINSLPAKQQQRLKESWADTFYKEVFCRIPEENLAILYSDEASRPNIPVNVLLGLEILKDGYGWTDEEMYNNFCYNVQVRYGLGYRNLEEGHFELRTVYNFRGRHTRHMAETGENLFEICFEQITDEQMEAFKVKGGIQRMDSKQIASNIREMSRLQLLVEVVQRVYRMLSAADKMSYHEVFEPYIKQKSGRYIYRLKGEVHQPHIEQVGQLLARLVDELDATYQDEETYGVLQRVFEEHFIRVEEEEGVRAKNGDELQADSLQSPDDLEATFRRKRGEGHVGYVVNVTETADPKNELQLITKVQTESNTTDDAAMLAEALPDLAQRTEIDTLYTDGTYSSPAVDDLCCTLGIDQVQTGIRGAQPAGDKLPLSEFIIVLDKSGTPCQATCPHGQTVNVTTGRKPNRFLAVFSQSACLGCADHDRCPTEEKKRQPQRTLYFSLAQLIVARRRQRMKQAQASGRNLRAAVEATVREISCRFNNAQLRVRGQSRVSMTLIAAAAMANARRIWRYQQVQRVEARQESARQVGNTQNGSDRAIGAMKLMVARLIRPWGRNLRYYSAFSAQSVKFG